MSDARDPRCIDARAWLSAHRDGQAHDEVVHRAHIDECCGCRRWMADADRVTQRLRIHAVGTSPDVAASAVQTFRGRTSVLEPPSPLGRGMLAAAGAMALIVALIGFTSGRYAMALDSHLGAELHAFEAALGVAFLLAARSPRRYVSGLLPITGTLAILSAAASTTAMSAGSIDPFMELSHIPPLAALAGLVLLVSDPGRRPNMRVASA